MVRVGVVGAGVVGLSTALNVQQQLPTARVTVMADKFGRDTTSDGVGGLFRPTLQHIKGVPEPQLRQWVGETWRHLSTLALSPYAGESGNSVASGKLFYHNPPEMYYKDFIFSVREMSDKERNALNGRYKHGYFATTVITDMGRYLPWLLNNFQAVGGQIEERRISSFTELSNNYDVVVNCTGMEAKGLTGDDSLYPVRGQLLRVKAPWIKHWCLTEEDTYIIPLAEAVLVGGVRQTDREDTAPDPEDSRDIWNRAARNFPYLQGSKVESEWAGLRPTREPPRIEREEVLVGGRKLQLVHNYGHGGNGVSLSWGTASYAARLVKEAAACQPVKVRF